MLTEFNADNSQLPTRAYILDICLPQDHAKALSMLSLMSGVGGSFGYAIGAIDWSETFFAKFLGDNVQTLFCQVAFIYFVAVIVTVTSFREIPLDLVKSDVMLQPITQVTIKNEIIKKASASNLEKNQAETKDHRKTTSLEFLRSIILLPRELKILCVVNCFAWMGHIVYCLFFTDFVGDCVFGGDPKAAPGSDSYEVSCTLGIVNFE